MNYLKKLQKKEKKVLFKIKDFVFHHKHLSIITRVTKGILFGFALGNIFAKQLIQSSTIFILSLISFIISLILINYERRHYNRKGWNNSLKILMYIFLSCLIFSSITLIYANLRYFFIVLPFTIFFASVAYSLE